MHDDADVARVVALFRLNYDRPWRDTKVPGSMVPGSRFWF
jgi:hypothetical protein